MPPPARERRHRARSPTACALALARTAPGARPSIPDPTVRFPAPRACDPCPPAPAPGRQGKASAPARRNGNTARADPKAPRSAQRALRAASSAGDRRHRAAAHAQLARDPPHAPLPFGQQALDRLDQPLIEQRRHVPFSPSRRGAIVCWSHASSEGRAARSDFRPSRSSRIREIEDCPPSPRRIGLRKAMPRGRPTGHQSSGREAPWDRRSYVPDPSGP